MKISQLVSLLFVAAIPGLLDAVEVKTEDMADAGQFMAARFDAKTIADPVFAFVYDGQSSRDLIKNWMFKGETILLDEYRKQTTLTYTDPATKLEARCVVVQWLNFPVVEWTVYLKNTSDANSLMIENLRAIDTLLNQSEKDPITFHYNRGDDNTINSYAVKQSDLAAGGEMRFAAVRGRPSQDVWPYYNFDIADKGFLMAIGWPGQWSAKFSRDNAGLYLNAGQEKTHFVLLPGEEFRTPLIAMMFYQGDWIRGQNLWRQWILKCNFPKDHGEIITPKLAGVSGWHFPGLNCNQQGEIDFLNGYKRENIKLDYWWMDAGWYPCNGNWGAVGTWEVDKSRYPQGIRAVSDQAHSQEVQTILWFEPERISNGSWLTGNHPEWILGTMDRGLLDLGNPKAWDWLVNHVDKILTDEGIDLYRQDFNIDPLEYWQANDKEDRQGITENKYVVGYLAYWDQLQKRHPGMLIDSCASGGRRDDLETMRRAIPLLQTDFEFNDTGNQCFTYGFDMWLPFHARGACRTPQEVNRYAMYGNIASPMITFAMDTRRTDMDYDLIRKFVGIWRNVSIYYSGDFYPLTPYSIAETDWMAWQFNRTDMHGGVVSAFRRSQCDFRSAAFKLNALDPKAEYRIENVETNLSFTKSGAELMEKGLLVEIQEQPGAVIFKYSVVQ